MQVPARLKWVAEEGRFAAYPTGFGNKERAAVVSFIGVFGQGTAIGPMPTWQANSKLAGEPSRNMIEPVRASGEKRGQ